MRLNSRLRPGLTEQDSRDPREAGGADVIDLATRHVLPTVTQRKRADGFGLVAGIAIVAAMGGLTLWSMDTARNGPAKPAENFASAPAPAPIVPAEQPAPPAVQPAPPPAFTAPRQNPLATTPLVNPNASPTVLFDASGAPATSVVPGTRASAPTAGTGTGAAGSNEDFAARLGGLGGVGSGGKAVADSTFDPKTTVAQGTLIPAVLETAINTDVPGFVRAVVSTDVLSFDGSRVLVPRSSRLVGQYKSGLSAGQKRAYVIWTRLIRPDGVSVDLGSPAVTFGGETGLDGKVNSHFFARFGSAMLLSVIGGLSTIASGGASVIIGGGSQSAAAAAIGQTGQISPTIRVRQGEPIRVFTAKDLDFSKVS